MLKEKLTVLKQKLIEYAALIENMLEKSMTGLVKKDDSLFEDVIKNDEPRSNGLELDIDKLGVNTIARFQPIAKDLRTILMGLKMNNDLERMGDLSVNICESGQFLIVAPPVTPLTDISQMANEVTKGMLKSSIDSFVNEDAKLAKSVCERDSFVDELKDKIVGDLIKIMGADPSTIERAFHLVRIAQHLERIADLSTNICEDVIFMTEGRVIKHNKFDVG